MGVRRVLLVEPDPRHRRTYGEWFEAAGYEVTACPGPTTPDYECVGGRQGRCPLVEPADVVVLDLDLDSEVEAIGTSAFQLLNLYAEAGKPVVAIGTDLELLEAFPDRAVTGMRAPPNRPDLVRTAETLARTR
jgi:CheY-like chemotaxis protein